MVIDATDQVLGRLCSKVAKILRGKHKPTYSPYTECGDNVIIINADKVVLTGKKMTDRIYLNYTGYPGGQRELTPEVLMKKSYNKHLKPASIPCTCVCSKACSPRTVLAVALSRTYTCTMALNTPTRLRNPKSSILTK